jgi:metal-responsive CopG/Arc/MetJ family transcriptional regulator
MTVKSSSETWTQVRIEMGLMREVDKVIEGVHVFGARKYWSRNDFVKEAVLRLLREYDEQEQLSRTKKGKEEILVARK